MFATLRAIFVLSVTMAYILLLGPPMLIYSLLAGNTRALYRVAMAGARMAMWLAGIRVEVLGRENILFHEPVVFMPNHQSIADPPAVMVHLPIVLVLVKQESFRVPVLGWAMRLHGFLPVSRRKNREEAIQVVEQAAAALKSGHSFLVYPEGTRSPDGRLQPFKKGVFVMALKAGAPIVPISVSGANKIMRKGEVALRPGVIRLTVHPPISTAGMGLEARDKVMQQVRRAILSGLAPEEWPLDAKENPTSLSAATKQL
ncbi:MAG: 1-acyl-sn-glycerol-3-phosphate acyltransferase [Acidobacteria bacterium]|nr:MAG: 1-acyl-sn-glycerol-3-phosphate acyltransferase [Acidobacteriota bacterium]